MASAQVMSNSAVSSRKQEHLEAGRRRLEEFRKKKAAEKAAKKKEASTSQPRAADSVGPDKQASENGQAQFANLVTDARIAAMHARIEVGSETSAFLGHNDKAHGLDHISGSESVALTQANSHSHNFGSRDLFQMQPKQEGESFYSLALKSQTSSTYQQENKNTAVGSIASRDDGSYVHSTFYGVQGSLSSKDKRSESLSTMTSSRNGLVVKACPEESVTNVSYNESAYVAEPFSKKSTLFLKDHFAFEAGERQLDAAEENLSSFYRTQAAEPPSAGFDTTATFIGSLYSSAADIYPRKSRPSFLDSLHIGKDSSGGQEKYTSSSNFPSSSFAASSTMQEPSMACAPKEPLGTPASSNTTTGFVGSTFTGQKLFENNLKSQLQTTSLRQNEDFAALEQHIEDLTQEKFSLQRAVEASKALSESLAAENSSLTESYNQQTSIVNQLKTEIERLQGEIKARLVELEATKAEYINAQLECNAADERAKLLASEVISLEEKALRLRSNELKLERELENASGEIASYKKKLASLDKERQDLLQTIDALQEEKKLLQSKLRRASASGVTLDINKAHAKTDASMPIDDLGPDAAGKDGENSELTSSSVHAHEEDANLLLLSPNRDASHYELAMIIPPDQAQMIQNIDSLISEIKAEKDELMQALVTEVSTSTRLKELNKELSHKLEVQTQRLELLTAQTMASENATAREATGSRIVRESVAYADEGDEVVERVLGWIMKLFPGGPSKRRPSRL